MNPKVATLVLLSGVIACAPSGMGPGDRGQGRPAEAQRTLVAVTGVEPQFLHAKLATGAGAGSGGAHGFLNASLAYHDERAVAHPFLAEELPRLHTSDWQVFPDGRMETTYRLRLGLTWHNGVPLTADDFAFSFRMYADPQLGGIFGPSPQRLIDEIISVDDRTLLIRWRQPHPEAGALGGGQGGFPPLARHILEPALRDAQLDVLSNHPYWTREFIGPGPFRLDRWEPGAFIEASAFDGFVFGRPKIDRVRLIPVTDPNAALANLLSGDAHIAIGDALRFQQAAVLKRSWSSTRAGTVLLSSSDVLYLQVQFRQEFVNPRALLDLRVRRALRHSMDAQALNEGMLDGEGVVADTIIAPEMFYYPAVERVITKYPHDPRRADQLLTEAGLGKGPDGMYANAAGDRFHMEVRGIEQNQLNILVDSWRRLGIDASPHMLPPVQAAVNELRATFPALGANKSGLAEYQVLTKLVASEIATPERRWAGFNKGGWHHPEYNRLFEGYNEALAEDERASYVVQMMKIVSEELPLLPMYYNLLAVAHTSALRGPMSHAPGGSGSWNLHLWELR